MVDCYVRTNTNNISPHFIDTDHTTDDPNPQLLHIYVSNTSHISYILSYVSPHYVRVGG